MYNYDVCDCIVCNQASKGYWYLTCLNTHPVRGGNITKSQRSIDGSLPTLTIHITYNPIHNTI